MSGYRSHAYLKTRIAIMADRLMSDADLDLLIQSSLDDIAARFHLPALGEEHLSPPAKNRAVARTLILQLMQDLVILMRPLPGNTHAVLVHWARKYELFNLKALIRCKINGLPDREIQEELYELPDLIGLPHSELLRTENVLELLRRLEQFGPYYEIARQARQVYEARNEPFSLDGTIDQRYFFSLLRRAEAVEFDDRAPLMDLVLTLVDHQNLLWLMRYRLNYALPPSETHYLLIHRGRHIPRPLLLRLVEITSLEELVRALPPALAQTLEAATNVSDAEHLLEQRLGVEARRIMRQSPSALARALAYLVLRELDLKRVFAVVQGLMLRLSPELIRYSTGRELLREAA